MTSKIIDLLTAIGVAVCLFLGAAGSPSGSDVLNKIIPGGSPKKTPEKRKPLFPLLKPRPDGGFGAQQAEVGPAGPVGRIHAGGPSDGDTVVTCDLPTPLLTKNVGGSDGQGLCVFSSIGHAARYQNEELLKEFQLWMRSKPGGGWPQKVDEMIERFAKERSVTAPLYLQYEGQDPAILEAALASGRMPSVTYDGRDGVFYSGRIAHMVNLVYLDGSRAAIRDNNFVGENQILWMSRDEFLSRWRGGRNGWAVILLAPAPAPVPRHS